MKASIQFDTNSYKFSHGKSPKGSGAWGFEWKAGNRSETVFYRMMTLTQAKRQLVKDLTEMGISWASAKVMP